MTVRRGWLFVIAAIVAVLALMIWWGGGDGGWKRAVGGGDAGTTVPRGPGGERAEDPAEELAGEHPAAGPRYWLRGHVVDAGGGAIPGARVKAGAAAVEADDDGEYAVRLVGGTYDVTADADGYAAQTVAVRVTGDVVQDFRLQPAAQIRGKVVREDGAAVSGAMVAVAGEAAVMVLAGGLAEPGRMVASGEGGAFVIEDVEPGTWVVVATAGEESGVADAVAVSPGEVVEGVIVTIGAGTSVSGKVVDARGAAMADVYVRLVMPGHAGAAVVSGSDGGFRIERVPPGSGGLVAEVDGNRRATTMIRVGRQPLEGVTIVVPDAVECSGRVLAGAGVGGAGGSGAGGSGAGGAGAGSAKVVVAVREAGDDTVGQPFETAADYLGGFRVVLPPGEARVRVTAVDGTVGIAGPIAIVPGKACELEVTLGAGARISGTVKWDDGTVAADVRVLGAGAVLGGAVVETRSGADGRYQLAPFEAGVVWVWAAVPGSVGGGRSQRPVEHTTLTLAAGEARDGVDLVIAKASLVISGRVIGPDGTPLAGALVGAAREVGGRNPRLGDRSLSGKEVTSGGDGSFELTGLEAGTYLVWSTAPGLPEAQVPHVVASAAGVVVRFSAATGLRGVVVDESGKPVADYTIAAVPAEVAGEDRERTMARVWGPPFAQHRLEIHRRDGRFAFTTLAADRYLLIAVDAAGRSGAAVGHDGENTIIVGDSATVRGRVVDRTAGAPIAGVPVSLQLPATVDAVTAADGTFALKLGATVPQAGLWFQPPLDRYVPDGRVVTAADQGDVPLLPGNAHGRPSSQGNVGVEGDNVGGALGIVRVTAGSPAARAGLAAGMAVTAVDDLDVRRMGGGTLRYLLAGERGTTVRLGVLDAAGSPRTVSLTRE